MDVLVLDIGGTRVKVAASRAGEPQSFRSGPQLTPDALVSRVRSLTHGWTYDVVAIGYPGAVAGNSPAAEPGNLGAGWARFDFAQAFDCPVRVVNDAVLQALGAYESGRMLFLGLGTGVASALVTEHVVIPLELGCLPHVFGGTIVERLGKPALARDGKEAWRRAVLAILPLLRDSFAADYLVLGGGNAKQAGALPSHTRRGGNGDAFRGGFRLWEEVVEPHDREPPPVWRVVR
jgi:polyphosphate glucokinase